MIVLLLVSLAAVASTTTVIAALLPEAVRRRSVVRGVSVGLAAALVTLGAGLVLDVEHHFFLIAVGAAATPVALLLGTAADDTVRPRWADAVVAVWGALVFPVSVVMPALILGRCASPDCRVEDYGATLPLLVSSAVSALFAWGSAYDPGHIPVRRFVAAAVIVWMSSALWLGSIEGALNEFTLRILIAAIAGPVGGAVAWLVVDLMRASPQRRIRSAALGGLAGFVAVMPGAATLLFPWALAVGALAAVCAALVYGAGAGRRTGRSRHWAAVVITAVAVGFFAPAVYGDAIGFIFSGRLAALVPPVVMFAAVGAFSVAATGPLWLLGRRRA